MSNSNVVRGAWLAGVGFFVVLGGWPFLSPGSFFDALAPFPPYNAHLLRDVGVFTLGTGGALVAAALRRDALFAALAGASVAAVLHVVSHIVDADKGGRDSDPWLLGLFAVVMVAGAVGRVREVDR